MISSWLIKILVLVFAVHQAGCLVLTPRTAMRRWNGSRPKHEQKSGGSCVYAMGGAGDVKTSFGTKTSNVGVENVVDHDDLATFLDSLPVRVADGKHETQAKSTTTPVKRTSQSSSLLQRPSPVTPEVPEGRAKESLVVEGDDDNAPIDWVLSRRLPQNTRRFYRRAIKQGRVKINNRTVKSLVRVRSGSTIFVSLLEGSGDAIPGTFSPSVLFPEYLPEMVVVHEDKYFFAVWKPAGMVCQPCQTAKSGTVLHGLLHHMIQTNQVKEGDLEAAKTLSQGIVHRLDKHTSGVMIVAKTLAASSKLSALFKQGLVKKEYVAICHGDPGFDSMVDVPLFRRSSGKIGAVSKSRAGEYGAREAKTRVRNVATIGGISLCRAEILTGRMHQVRAHLKHMGCPLVGDKEYGDVEANRRLARRNAHRVMTDRPLLHSMSLEFEHPFTEEFVVFKSPMPEDMWRVAADILHSSGTREQREEFRELQNLR